MLENPEGRFSDLEMAAWTPGSYQIRDYAGQVEGVKATDDGGNILPVTKTDKDTWRVDHGNKQSFTLRYSVYCGQQSVQSPYVDQEHASLVPAGLFLYPASLDLPCTITVKPWPAWKQISSSLDPAATDRWVLRAPDRDIFLDSPIEIGNQQVLRFTAAEVLHEFAIQGSGNYDTAKIRSDVTTIVEAFTEMFDHNPNKRYVFILNNTASGYGGLEHLASTSMIYRRWGYEPQSEYQIFLGLVSHEYFHTWNIKRIVPAEFSTYDYSAENYSRSLWIAEGFTSYYDDLMLCRSGLIGEWDYLGLAARKINAVANRPGDAIQSAAESSFDAWIKYYRSNENSSNSTVSYYDKGLVLAMALDLDILVSTGGVRRLDDVFRELYSRYRSNPDRGYTEKEFMDITESVAGHSLDTFFSNHVYGTVPLRLESYLDRIGVELRDDGLNQPALTVGAVMGDGNKVRQVVRGQPAFESGIQAGDEILAIDGYRFTGDLGAVTARSDEGDTLFILLSRDNRIITVPVQPRKITRFQYRLIPELEATDEQKLQYRQWLGLSP